MLVSGADLAFVGAAVQSWSLPGREASLKINSTAQKNFTLSLAVLTLAGLANVGQGLIVSGTWAGKTLLSWLVVETLYFIVSQLRYAAVNRVVEVPLDPERVQTIKKRFLSLSAVMSMEDFLSGWFQGVPAEQIRRRNVEDFVAYGFYCRNLEQLPPKLQQSVRQFVRDVETSYGRKLEDGCNPNIAFMAHLWEPLRALHTPLCVHLGSESAAVIAHAVLKCWGFKRNTCQSLGYWYRPGLSSSSSTAYTEQAHRDHVRGQGVLTRSMANSIHQRGDSASSLADQALRHTEERPLVFIHGVGFGVTPYLGFLWSVFRANAGHPMVVLDLPHVALRPFRRAKSVDSIAAATKQILREQGFTTACFMGHSFGSFCISRICQLFPETVDSIVLMDPVCCLTCYPQLLFNFVYKKYSLQEALSSLMGFANVIRYIFSRDLIIAETFCRQFLWHSLMLWPEDMPAKAVISISANDDLVPAELVKAHLRSCSSPAEVMLHPTAAHGGIFLDAPYQKQLLSHVQRLLRSC